MRLDELPTSNRVEDRRGVPGGRAGIGIGTVVVLTLIGWAFGIKDIAQKMTDAEFEEHLKNVPIPEHAIIWL